MPPIKTYIMLRTNSKKYLNNIETFILSAIDGTDYDTVTETKKQKLTFLFDCFDSEFNYSNNVKRYPNLQDRFAQWLQGLPSSISLPFYYNDILELSKNLLEVDELSKAKENTICKNYWSFMAYHIIKMHDNISNMKRFNKTQIKEIVREYNSDKRYNCPELSFSDYLESHPLNFTEDEKNLIGDEFLFSSI